MTLAEPTMEALDAIRRHAPAGVCEIGAGEGLWLDAMMRAGIPCVGYDIRPRGPLVALGDHYSAARHHELALLAVWPPDGNDFAKWCSVWRGAVVMACGVWLRFDVGLNGEQDWLPDGREIEAVNLPPGVKGGSQLRIFARGGQHGGNQRLGDPSGHRRRVPRRCGHRE